MNKKIFISILIVFAILLSTFVFANNDTTLGNELKNSIDKSGDTLQNVGEGARNVASDIGNGIQNAASNVGQGVENMFDGNDDNWGNNNNNGNNENDGYVATRTTTDGGAGMTGMMNNTTWIWLIMGIVAVAIVGLTWYYVTQNTDARK